MPLFFGDGRRLFLGKVLEVGLESLLLPLVVEAVHHRDVVTDEAEDDGGAAEHEGRPKPDPQERNADDADREEHVVTTVVHRERSIALVDLVSVVAIFAVSVHGHLIRRSGLARSKAREAIMTDPLHIRDRIVIPADAMTLAAVRSSGPGGQNVNKVASKVELRIDLARITGLDPAARARLENLARPMLDAEGLLLVKSQKTRDQRQNLEDARAKVRALVEQALVRPKQRRATRPTRGSVERRIAEKKARSRTKSDRRGRDD